MRSILVCIALIGVWSLPVIPAQAAESSTRPAAYSKDPRVKAPGQKTIPGSKKSPYASKPGSYIQPKKQTYQQHMEAQKAHRFKNETDEFGYGRAASPSDSIAAHSSSRVLTSTRPPSSRIHIQSNPGRPGAELLRNQPLTSAEHHFLNNLTSAVGKGDPGSAARLDAIRTAQKQGKLLSPGDHEFLAGLANKVGDPEAAMRLRLIAEKRRERS